MVLQDGNLLRLFLVDYDKDRRDEVAHLDEVDRRLEFMCRNKGDGMEPNRARNEGFERRPLGTGQ